MDKDVRGIVVVNDHNVNGMLSSHDCPQQTVLYHALTLLGGAVWRMPRPQIWGILAPEEPKMGVRFEYGIEGFIL